jgi:hypothetical protein
MKTVRRTKDLRGQDLGIKREKIIQKLRKDKNRRASLLTPSTHDDTEDGELEQLDSMTSNEGIVAQGSSASSFGAHTMSEDALDLTNYSNDAMVDEIIQQQMLEEHSDSEEEVAITKEVTASKVQDGTMITRWKNCFCSRKLTGSHSVNQGEFTSKI